MAPSLQLSGERAIGHGDRWTIPRKRKTFEIVETESPKPPGGCDPLVLGEWEICYNIPPEGVTSECDECAPGEYPNSIDLTDFTPASGFVVDNENEMPMHWRLVDMELLGLSDTSGWLLSGDVSDDGALLGLPDEYVGEYCELLTIQLQVGCQIREDDDNIYTNSEWPK